MKMNWLDVVKQFGPMILAMTAAAPVAPYLVTGIEAGEALKASHSGPERLAHAKDVTRTIVAAVNAQKPGTVDPHVSDEALTHGIETVIAVANLIHKKAA